MKFLVRLMLCFMISFSLTELPIMQAHAGMINTSQAIVHMDRAQGEKNVVDFLNRSEVKAQLVKLGVNSQEATRRLASLSDSEVKKLSGDIEKATLGGDVGGILIIVLVVLLIIYLAKRI
ncbi:MAG TPA: PA2779 family protein [Bacteriovoracaceae bacterium]|nr:PA2779 family protein [Bacteriovoracaceae bacterium]